MKNTGLITLILWCVILADSMAQKQLIILRKGVLVARFSERGTFKFMLKNHQKKEGTILALNEHGVITDNYDTIQLQSIAKIGRANYFRVNIMRDVGAVLFYGGLIYFTAVELNDIFGYDKTSYDERERTALIAAAVGGAILFVKSPFRRLGKRMVMRVVDYTSPYYLTPLR